MADSQTISSTNNQSHGKGPSAPSTWRRMVMALRILQVRMRFVVVLVIAFAIVGKWDMVRNYWDKITRTIHPASVAVAPDTEYWCPMCPGVISEWPGKCPVCNMGLVRRRRGEMVPSSEGGLARMQLSPYRVQLAGVLTAAVEYRPLIYEVVTGGFVEVRSLGAGSSPGEAKSAPTPDGSPVWVQAELFEKDLALVAESQRVEVSSDAFPARTPFVGRVRKLVSPVAPGTRSPRVQLEIDNPRMELRPGMFVTARIKIPPTRLDWLTRALAEDWRDRTAAGLMAGALVGAPGFSPFVVEQSLLRMAGRQTLHQKGLVLSIPESAVIDTGSKKMVYLESGPGMFEPIEVVVGPRCGEYRPLLEGLEVGQRVVASGGFLVDAETRLNPGLAAGYFGAARGPAPVTSASERPADPGIARALARLSPADRALAIRQKLCPVTGQPLGSMGTPVRVELAGRTVFLCCAGCESEFKENVDKYLSKVPGK